MKKILFYIPSLAPSGGIERIVATIVNKLSLYYNVTILTKDDLPSFYFINPEVEILTFKLNYSLNMKNRWRRSFDQLSSSVSVIKKLKCFLKNNNFDFFYVTHPLSHIEFLFSGVDYSKIIISEHGASNNYNKIYRFIKRVSYKKSKYYCVPTSTDYYFYKNYGFPVYYTPHYKPDLAYERARLDKKIVLNIGRFTEDKQQLKLLKIWASIEEEFRKGWFLNIVGHGELEGDIIDFINKNFLSGSVNVFSPTKKIENFYQNSSIFALTSRSEGFGMVLLEAAGFGLPMIAFDCPSGPRDIINKTNGFLVNDDDNEMFKNKLIKMMNEKVLLSELSEGAYETAQNWSDEKITNIWREVFK